MSADGGFVVTGGQHDGVVRVFDIGTGAELRALTGHVRATARLWDLVGGACVRQWDCAPEILFVATDGRTAVARTRDGVAVWDGAHWLTMAGHTQPVADAAVPADGRIAVTASWDQTVRVWDLQAGSCLRVLLGHTGYVQTVALSGDGRIALSGSNHDRTLRVWDVAAGTCLRTWAGENHQGDQVALSADGRVALVSPDLILPRTNVVVSAWDAATGSARHEFRGHADDVRSVRVAAGRAVSSDVTGRLRVWDLATGRCLHTLRGGGQLAASADIAVTEDRRTTVTVWELSTGQPRREMRNLRLSGPSALSPDGSVLVCGHYRGPLQVWDVDRDTQVGEFTGHTDGVAAVAMSDDACVVVTESRDSTLRVWTLDWAYELATRE